MVQFGRSGGDSLLDRGLEAVDERAKRLAGEGHSVAEPVLHQWVVCRDVSAESGTVNVERLTPVSRPDQEAITERVDLCLPHFVALRQRVRADNQQVDVAPGVSLAPRGTPEERHVKWGNRPAGDGGPDLIQDVTAEADEILECRPGEVRAVRRVQGRTGMFLGADKPLRDEACQDELDAADAAGAGEAVNLAPGEPTGRAGKDLEDRRVERRDDATDWVREIHY